MTITAIPTRAANDLGAALSNVRSPVPNEFSAVNLEKIKDHIITLFSEAGLTDGSTAGSLWEAVRSLLLTSTVSLPIQNGATIAVGEAVAVSSVAGRCVRANAAANAEGNFIGICTVGGSGDPAGTAQATIRTAGAVTGLSGLTAHAPVWLSVVTPGAVTGTVPTGATNLSLSIGYAISTTSMVIHVGPAIVLGSA